MFRSISTTLVAVATAVALVGPANAQLTVTQDDQGDSAKKSDIKKVTVDHADKRVRIKTRMFRGSRLSDEMWHLVDTVGDSRPDFLAFVVIANEVGPDPFVSVRRVAEWPKYKNPYRVLAGERVDCGLRESWRRDHSRLLTTLLGRGCFRTDGEMPTRLRVNTFATFEWGKITDKAPSWREYGRWVTAD